MPSGIFARFAALAALAAMLALPAAVPAGARTNGPSTGLRTVAFSKPPPDFTFDAGDGPERLSGLSGKPVVLSFWATWCHPCRDELDVFAKLHQLYGDQTGLITLSDEAPGTARAYLDEHGLALPLVEDPQRKIFGAYSVARIPVTIVLRRDGTVANVTIGEISWPELQTQVEAVLQIKLPAPAQGPPEGRDPEN
jgi:cytochrome c biogenesis protein CcmG/thiol:disulfide interchange protein DsbE